MPHPTTDHMSLDGTALRDMFASGMAWLQAQAEYVNSLNVFPVPDGDTGTNLLLTMRSALNEASIRPMVSASEMAEALAKGGLMGARGNAGVIFSQILRGFQAGTVGKTALVGSDLPPAFEQASGYAYRAVSKPVEGTILTVIREVSAALLAKPGLELPATLQLAAATAQTWVARTPDLMPLLKENGVVDSGAQGLAFILDGMSHYVSGDMHVPAPLTPVRAHGGAAEFLAPPQFEGQRYGFCTEFFIESPRVSPDAIRAEFQANAASVMVAGDQALVKVHLHTLDPDAFLARGRVLGSLGSVKVEDMDAQHQQWRRKRASIPVQGRTAVVAVAAGKGLEEVLRSLGVAEIIPGGQTMNPSAQEILSAIEAVAADQVIVLPNNKNVVMAAKQARDLAGGKKVLVVPTENVPEGISAMLGFNYEMDAEQNAAAMDDGRSAVKTGEVTRAVRPASLQGAPVASGDFIGLVHDKLVVAAKDSQAAVEALVQVIGVGDGARVTLYYGVETTPQQAEATAAVLRRRYPRAEVDMIAGVQPLYHYLVAVE